MGNIHDLEKIQKRATKLIPSLQHLSYLERLQHLNLPSLIVSSHPYGPYDDLQNITWPSTQNIV